MNHPKNMNTPPIDPRVSGEPPAPLQLPRPGSNGNGGPACYGSTVLSQEVFKVTGQSIRVPREDKEFIRATAITRGTTGEADCLEYHSRLFDSQNAELLEQSRRLDQQLAVEEAGAERHVRELSEIQTQTDRYRECSGESVPWTKFDIVQVGVLAVMSAMLLGVGINTNASVLQSSGIAAFESPWRAILFSFIPVGLAVAVKVPGSHLSLKSRRLAYTYVVWGLGLVFGFLWAGQFARTFPNLTQSTAELIDALTRPQAAASDGHSSSSFILIAMLAEVFLAAGCWLTIQFIAEKHAPAVRTDNPAYLKVQNDLGHWHQRQAENRRLSGLLAGKIRAIDEARGHFITGAIGYFRAAVKLAVNDRHLNNFLNR